ncbi:hypothetical protein F5Y14DRAFT_128686 [Nemania sp. NC0429]|nr:hypothetical protein F5Y14DRAFT_128686 [Nemania sp. NC0429]
MDELKKVDYNGIGAGLPIPCCRGSWVTESTVSLSADDDWQMLLLHEIQRCDPHSDTETARHAKIIEPQTEFNKVPSASSMSGDLTQGNLSPLERYCCHFQAHELLALGLIPDRKSRIGPNQLNKTLENAAKLLGGLPPDFSASSWSILSSNPGESQNMIPPPKLDDVILTTDSAGSQTTPQEQAKNLHTIAKMKRRLRAESSPRQMKPVRVRKRSKGSNQSQETSENMEVLDLLK